jgi:rhodanese-related sulfurtransferase
MLWSLLILALVVAAWYWFEGSWDKKLFAAPPGKLCVNLHSAEAHAYLDAHPETQVLDVRSDSEFAGGAVPGAKQISIGDRAFSDKVAKLDRKRPVLIYCAGGFRSRKAVVVLKELGFENIQHLHRGYGSW